MHILITGASGLVGQRLSRQLLANGMSVRGTLLDTEDATILAKGVEAARITSLGPETLWQQALKGIDTVIHLAARVHMMDDRAAEPLALFRTINALAACATHPAAAGQTFPVSDGEDVATPELLRLCALALEVPLRLVPCPVTLLRLAGKGLEG